MSISIVLAVPVTAVLLLFLRFFSTKPLLPVPVADMVEPLTGKLSVLPVSRKLSVVLPLYKRITPAALLAQIDSPPAPVLCIKAPSAAKIPDGV